MALREIAGEENVRALSLLGPDDNQIEADFAVYWSGREGFDNVGLSARVAFATRALVLAATWCPDIIVSAHVNLTPLLSRLRQLSGGRTILNVYGLEIWSGLNARRLSNMAKVDYIIADCHATASYVTDEGLHHARPKVIWDPVDLDRFAPGPADQAIVAKYGLPDPSLCKIVMSLGRLAKAAAHKGFDRLIPIVASLKDRFPDLRLVIAGRGDDRPRLEGLVRDQGIVDRVIFTGSIDEVDLPALYRTAHVFSLVSDRGHGRGEGIPLTPLEAMACGVPVIVGDEDGSREAVVEGRNGVVVSPRDPVAHGAAIVSLFESPDRLSRLRKAARQVAETHFSFEEFVGKHRALLDDIARLRFSEDAA